MQTRVPLLLIVVMSLAAGQASAAIITYNFDMTVDQEVPSPNVSGFSPSGSAAVTIDDVLNTVEVSGSYTGMTSNVTAAHIHGPADFGESASPLITLNTTGGTDGTVSLATTTTSATNIGYIKDAMTYINVHTINNSNGEIRGQVVPEPAGAALLLAGSALLVARRTRDA